MWGYTKSDFKRKFGSKRSYYNFSHPRIYIYGVIDSYFAKDGDEIRMFAV